jgi:hypothetical protein
LDVSNPLLIKLLDFASPPRNAIRKGRREGFERVAKPFNQPAAFFCLQLLILLLQMLRHARIDEAIVVRLGELSKREIQVFMFLRLCWNEKTGRCDPSRATVSRAVGFGMNHISVAVRTLKEKGFLSGDFAAGFSFEPGPESGPGRRLRQVRIPDLLDDATRSRIRTRTGPESGLEQVQNPDFAYIGLNNERTTKEQKTVSVETGEGPPDAKTIEPKEFIFSVGLRLIIRSNVPEKNARSILGALRSRYGDKDTAEAVRIADDIDVSEPVAYLNKLLSNWKRSKTGLYVGSATADDAGIGVASGSLDACGTCGDKYCLRDHRYDQAAA